nr:MAG TPA: hypothetical protein [Caudoviricetes sp.]
MLSFLHSVFKVHTNRSLLEAVCSPPGHRLPQGGIRILYKSKYCDSEFPIPAARQGTWPVSLSFATRCPPPL